MINDKQHAHQVSCIWWMLKLTYGIVPIVAGADKFFGYLTNWQMYLHPEIAKLTTLSPMHIMYVVGAIEIAAGLLVLSNYTRIGAYIVALWLVAIAGNLIAMGLFYDIAVRDVVMAIGAIALAQLTQAVAYEKARMQ